MGNIVTLSDEPHLETQSLLPWYVSRRLDAVECARVEAHLLECPECRAELATERTLAAEWVALPIDTEASWLRLRERVARSGVQDLPIVSRLCGAVRHALAQAPPWFGGVGWILAAAQAMALIVVGLSIGATRPPPGFHALGARQAPAAGNMLVIFDPEVSERRFRTLLEAEHARLVDGPTAAGAYLLHVPVAERAAVLGSLRSQRDVELAQPIDPGVVR